MMVLLNDALLPNLVQTTEGAPAIVHCGPFANIAHGTSSVLAQRMGLHLADYVVNETGFAADLGAEKFFDIVMPMCGHVPSVAVVIVTLKALRAQGGSPTAPGRRAGFPNLERHLENLQRWGVPVVVALNRFPGDSDDDLERVRAYCASLGVEAALSRGLRQGRRRHDRPRRQGRGRGRGVADPKRSRRSTDQSGRSRRRSRRSRRRCTAPTASSFKPAARRAAAAVRSSSATATLPGLHRQDAVLLQRRSQS